MSAVKAVARATTRISMRSGLLHKLLRALFMFITRRHPRLVILLPYPPLAYVFLLSGLDQEPERRE